MTSLTSKRKCVCEKRLNPCVGSIRFMFPHAKTLFTPLQLGSVTLPNRLVQGPLAGYSCAPFRVMTARYGRAGFAATEMISAHDLAHNAKTKNRYLWRDPE